MDRPLNTFEKFPSIEITASGVEPCYRIRYTECVKDRGAIRFERKEKKVQKQFLERLVSQLIEEASLHAG